MKSIFLVNPISGRGHLDAYARLYSRALVELGYRVVLVAETDADAPGYLSRNRVVNEELFSCVCFGQATLVPDNASVASQTSRSHLSALQRARIVWQEEGPGAVLQRLIIVPLRASRVIFSDEGRLGWVRKALSGRKQRIFQWLSNYRIPRAIRKFLYPDSGRISFRRMLQYVQQASSLVGISQPDLVLFLYLDMMADSPQNVSALDAADAAPWIGILFHPRLTKTPTAQIEGYLKSKNARGGIFLVPAAIDAYAKATPRLEFALVPDVTDLEFADGLPAMAREIRHRAAGRKIVLQVGSIASHKGIATLLDVIAKANPKHFFFALVGEVHWKSFVAADEKPMRAFYASPPENVYVHEGYLREERDYNTIVAACDVIYAVYSGFNSSSNSLTKAAGLGRPILVTQDTLMGKRVMDSRIGLVAREGDSNDILAALHNLVAKPPGSFDFEQYAKEHSIESLKSVLEKALPRWLAETAE
jgi:glycosyltransferase involved in cell wall biosynthesis